VGARLDGLSHLPFDELQACLSALPERTVVLLRARSLSLAVSCTQHNHGCQRSQEQRMPGRGRPFPPGQSGNPAGGRKLARHTWPLARDILHKTILANQAEFEQKLTEVTSSRTRYLEAEFVAQTPNFRS
jgi:hypothetical protein